MNKNPRGMPKVGDEILIKASALKAWFAVTVSGVVGNDIVTGSGMGARVIDGRQYGKSRKWSNFPMKNRRCCRCSEIFGGEESVCPRSGDGSHCHCYYGKPAKKAVRP